MNRAQGFSFDSLDDCVSVEHVDDEDEEEEEEEEGDEEEEEEEGVEEGVEEDEGNDDYGKLDAFGNEAKKESWTRKENGTQNEKESQEESKAEEGYQGRKALQGRKAHPQTKPQTQTLSARTMSHSALVRGNGVASRERPGRSSGGFEILHHQRRNSNLHSNSSASMLANCNSSTRTLSEMRRIESWNSFKEQARKLSQSSLDQSSRKSLSPAGSFSTETHGRTGRGTCVTCDESGNSSSNGSLPSLPHGLSETTDPETYDTQLMEVADTGSPIKTMGTTRRRMQSQSPSQSQSQSSPGSSRNTNNPSPSSSSPVHPRLRKLVETNDLN